MAKPLLVKLNKRNAIESKWAVSYITVVFCCVFSICTALLIFGLNFAKNESQEKLSIASHKVSNILDQKIDFMKQTAIKLSLTDWISRVGVPGLTGITDPSTAISDAASITLELGNYCNIERSIHNITVFFPYTDTVYNKNGDFSMEEYFLFSNNYSKENYKQIREIFERNNYFNFLIIQHNGDSCGLLIYNCTSQGAIIVLEINANELRQSAGNGTADPLFSSLLIMEPDSGQFLLGGDPALNQSVLSAQFDPSLGNSKITTDDQSYLAVRTHSAATPYDYIFLYSPDYVSEDAAIIQQFVGFSALIALLLGSVLSIIFVSLNYRPLKKLVTQIKNAEGDTVGEVNEYQYIENTLSNWRVEVQKAQETSARYEKAVWHRLLSGILTGSVTLTKDNVALMSDNFLEYDGENFYCAVIIGILNPEKITQICAEKHISDIGLEFANCAGRTAVSEPVELWQHLSLEANKYVVLFCADHCLNEEESSRLFDRLREEIGSVFPEDICLAAGEFRKGLEGISVSFQIAEKLYVWQMFTGDTTDDGLKKFNRSSSRYYLYPHDWENKLINEALKGNIQEVSIILDDIINENCQNKTLSIQMKKRLISRLLETAYTILSKMEKEDFELFAVIEQKLDEMNETQCWNSIRKLFSAICEMGFNNQIKLGENRVYSEIVDYVSQNYTDYNISLKDISAKFTVQEYAVSKMFKSITGYNFLDYVNRRRIDLAKKLLRTTEEPIYLIAEKIGFDNDRSFRRVFKKYEGIGPLDFRNMKKGEEDGQEDKPEE